MFRRQLIALALLYGPTVSIALAQDTGTVVPNPSVASSHQGRQVKLFRLNHADAESIGRELSAVLPFSDVRVIADKRTNSVIVAAPAAVLDSVTNAMATLDAPQAARNERQPSRDEIKQTEIVPLRQSNVDLIARALDELVAARRAKGESTAVAVVKASPVVEKALGAISQPQPAQPGHGQAPGKTPGTTAATASGQSLRIRVLHLSSEQARSIAEALTRASAGESRRPGAVVVSPSQPTSGKGPSTGARTEPPLR